VGWGRAGPVEDGHLKRRSAVPPTGKEQIMLVARILFAVAALNLLLLFSELSINVVRAFLG
jgi:hypothetical protein